MSKSGWISISMLALGVVMLAVPVVGAAQDGAATLRPDHCPAYQPREITAGALTEQTYRRLEPIYEMIGDAQYSQAHTELQALLERVRRDEYEQAMVHQALGHVTASMERYDDAIHHFQRSIDLNRMPNNVHFEMKMQVANLHYSEGRYRETLDVLDDWLCSAPAESFSENTFLLQAGALAELEEYRDAIVAINTAIEMSDNPREQWFVMRLGLQFQLEEYRGAADTLRTLIQMSPDNKQHWTQLSQIYLELNDEPQALNVLKLAYRKGMLDRQTEYLQLASLLQEEGIPYMAAEVMQQGIEAGIVEASRRHWEIVAGAWYEAKELDDALVAYERAAERADDGKLYLQRAHILVNQERWDEVSTAITNALEMGGLSQSEEGNANLLLGMAEFNLDNFNRAERAFNVAAGYSGVQQPAREWLNHIQRERERRSS